MELIPEMERLIHLIARAFAKTSGSESPDTYADTVVAHARALADVPAEDPTEKTTEQLASPVQVLPEETAPAASVEAPVPHAADAASVEHTGE
jgi:hypothetical protein